MILSETLNMFATSRFAECCWNLIFFRRFARKRPKVSFPKQKEARLRGGSYLVCIELPLRISICSRGILA